MTDKGMPADGVRRVDVESAADMHDAVMRELPGTQIYVSTAAVADYRPAKPADRKIKKTQTSLDLDLERTVDILAAVSAHPQRPFVVGFAAETNDVEMHARQKLAKKNLDLIAANEVGDDKVFEKDDNALMVLWRDGGRQDLGPGPKTAIAGDLVALVAKRWREAGGVAPRSPAAAVPQIGLVRG